MLFGFGSVQFGSTRQPVNTTCLAPLILLNFNIHTCIESASFSPEAFPLPELDESAAPVNFSAFAFSASFLVALALALADVDKTAVGSFTAEAAVGTVVGRGYSNNDGLACDKNSNFGTFKS
ncbi:hypothetical protein HanIR_Chr02g0098761 [Helianthus annuus]|nr:hypothetical protein HanIR_Chr02g0098761 [Helianthus annuus]